MALVIQINFTFLLSLWQKEFYYNFQNGVLINCIFITVSYLIIKLGFLVKIKKTYDKYSKLILIILLNLLLGALLFLVMWRINKGFVWDYFAIIISGVLIWGLINVNFLYQSIKISQQKKVILTHEKYIPYLRSLVDEVRQRQHDVKNHFNVLYGLVTIEDDHVAKKEIQTYLESIVDRLSPIDQLLNISDTILTAIIYSKKNLAEEKRIVFSFKVHKQIPEYPLRQYELVEILGNLLDNAIEATENLTTGDKKIVLVLGVENDKYLIQIENSRDINKDIHIDQIFEKGYSTKEGKHRGYGLYNVKNIVNAYNGIIELSFNETSTIFKVLF